MVLNNRDWWRVHLQRIEAEELTTKAYADREGLDVQSLYYWRKVFRSETSRQPRASRPATSSFVGKRSNDAVISFRRRVWISSDRGRSVPSTRVA